MADPFWNTITDLLMLLGAALGLGILFERLRQSAILGYLLAGVLLGPHALGFTQSATQSVRGMAELGVALLLFAIGLEFSFKKLMRIGAVGLLGGILQVVLTAAIGAVFALVFGMEARLAVASGLIVAMSSTACVLRVLADSGRLESVYGRNALGILLLQDMAVLPAMLLATMLGSDEDLSAAQISWQLGRSVLLIVGLAGGFAVLSRFVLPRLLSAAVVSRNRELLVLVAAVLALGSTWAAHQLHLSPAIGAFLAGMLLAESPFSMQIRTDIGAVRALFVALFFASVGMLGDPVFMFHNAGSVLLVTGMILVGKMGLITLIVRGFGQPFSQALPTGLCLAQVGEFSFVLTEIVFLRPDDPARLAWLNLFVSATLLSLLLTPYLITLAPRAARWLTPRSTRPDEAGDKPTGHTADGGVIVIGFGPAGRKLAEALQEASVRVAVVDMQPVNIAIALDQGLAVTLGDASNPELLHKLGLERAQAVAITLPDHDTVLRIMNEVHTMAPGLPVIVRARYHRFVADFEAGGAELVVDEEEQIGLEMGRTLAGRFRKAPDAQTPTDPA